MRTADELAKALGAAVHACAILAEAVRTAGEIPSGHLYAMTLGAFDSVSAYEGALDVLKLAGLVEECGHMLRWVGPRITAKALCTCDPADGFGLLGGGWDPTCEIHGKHMEGR